LKEELEETREMVADIEKEKARNKDKAERHLIEISKLQSQLNNLNVQLYGKDEFIQSLQQQLNTVLTNHRNIPYSPRLKHVTTSPEYTNQDNSSTASSRKVVEYKDEDEKEEVKHSPRKTPITTQNEEELLLPSQQKEEKRLTMVKAVESELLNLQFEKKRVIFFT